MESILQKRRMTANYAAIAILEALGVASPTEYEINAIENAIQRSKTLKKYLGVAITQAEVRNG